MTAEFAVVLPVLVLLLAAVLAAGSAGVAKLRCIDAARSAARLAARHEPAPVILSTARSAAPKGATIRLFADADRVRVQVTAPVQLPLPGRPIVELEATAVAQLEEDPAAAATETGYGPFISLGSIVEVEVSRSNGLLTGELPSRGVMTVALLVALRASLGLESRHGSDGATLLPPRSRRLAPPGSATQAQRGRNAWWVRARGWWGRRRWVHGHVNAVGQAAVGDQVDGSARVGGSARVDGSARADPAERERGSGTVLMLVLMSLAGFLVTGTLVLASVIVARHRAEAIADLSALAAAGSESGSESGSDVCGRARRVADANGGRLVGCRILGDGSVMVGVAVDVSLTGDLVSGPARGWARAGPGPSASYGDALSDASALVQPVFAGREARGGWPSQLVKFYS